MYFRFNHEACFGPALAQPGPMHLFSTFCWPKQASPPTPPDPLFDPWYNLLFDFRGGTVDGFNSVDDEFNDGNNEFNNGNLYVTFLF